MKVLKKFAGMILAVCLMVPMIGTVAFAAEGVLMFSDPSAQVGDEVDIDFVVQSSSGETVGDVEVTMTYDTTALEFVSGDGFTADGSGTLTYSGTGDGAELRETVTFRALTTGTAVISVDSSTAALASGETLELSEGSSTVTIEAADDGTTSIEASGSTSSGETTDIVVTVNGTDYYFSEAFTANDIPDGYSETTLTFNSEERTFVANEAGVTLGYLVDSSGAGSFFLFDEEDATFSPYYELEISETTSIILLSDADSVSLSDDYQEVELTVDDQQFPAWADPSDSRYYVLYALNTRTGESGLYQYDTEDETYQYFTEPEDTDESSGSVLPGSIGELIGDHILLVLIALALVILILFILAVVFAVKLVHRNQELDDLYDEYDIPYDEEDKEADAAKPDKKKKKKAAEEPEDDEYDDEDDEYDDDYEDDDDEYDYGDDEYDEYDDEDDDDYDDAVTTRVGRGGKRKKSSSSEDDYDIDFIDL